MRLFACQNCSHVLYFENHTCERCGYTLGYVPHENELSALVPAAYGKFEAMAVPGKTFRFCDNAIREACNWLIPDESIDRYCVACRHNGTVPNLSEPARLREWRKMEVAKHRLFYTLLRLDLPTPTREEDPKGGLLFHFLADLPAPHGAKVLTGHDEGIITLALKEADDAERERRRTSMHEPYRTLLGHFRHEVGHYYWDRLVRDQRHLAECRAVFGNDKEDYNAALKRHYKDGAPANWQENFVSTYATAHAWEDFAETWAHYLHIVDSLETAASYGLEVHPSLPDSEPPRSGMRLDPYQPGHFDRLITHWLPLTSAMNGMNRSMGLNDLYPFILSQPAIRKLAYIHELVHPPRHLPSKTKGRAA